MAGIAPAARPARSRSTSAPLPFIAVFASASIEPLPAMLDDAGKDMRVRTEALKWIGLNRPKTESRRP